ncbi:MAG: methyltransferase, partial [Candidatus Obscuribacterales bacterium]|nr:methyltransferase [Candidatus Obscuribacterales bacterium]
MTVSYVIDNFSRAVETYDKYASIQAIAASELSLTLSQVEASIPQGRILEFGCGTGIFSRYLAACLPGRTVIFSDASSEMVEVCRLNIRDLNSDKFQQRIFSCLDATRIQTEERFSMIAASFVLQWLPDLKGAI